MTKPSVFGKYGNGRLKLILALIGVFFGGGLGIQLAGDLLWLHQHRLETPAVMRQYTEERPLIAEQLKILRESQKEIISGLNRLTDELKKEREERIREQYRR